ncbi:MAG TPA: (2Fe-2S)-binding protein [Acidimicrobiia bacterium]
MTREQTITVTVNAVRHAITVPTSMTLLEMVRSRLGLTGSKECCSVGECGACTMILGDEPVNSCLILAVEADGTSVITIEGIGAAGMSPLQKSFVEAGAVQCGFCIPGMVVAATALLERVADPTLDEVQEALSGNLCRCGGYSRICSAVQRAATPEATDV